MRILLYSVLVICLHGCGKPAQKPTAIEKVTIGQLAPLNHSLIQPIIKTNNFNIEIIQIPKDNAFALDVIRQMFPAGQFEFGSEQAFEKNKFWVGFGDPQLWSKVSQALKQADAEKIETISLLLPDGQYEDVKISELPKKTDMYYFPESGSIELIRLYAGYIALRLKATATAGSRGVCDFQAMPVRPSPSATGITQLYDRQRTGEISFRSLYFETQMTPQTFVLLAPTESINGGSSPADYFFGRGKFIRIYLIICARVID
ncbi:MAG: hypothetical protein ISS77_05535 [Phycisphaerae bacterium]|nr:hypothetical protein [Phycisphaerae bacterium]